MQYPCDCFVVPSIIKHFHIPITLSPLLWSNGHTVHLASNHFHVPTPRSKITVKPAILDLRKCKMCTPG